MTFSVNVTESAGLRIWSHLLEKSLMENFIFCVVLVCTIEIGVHYSFIMFFTSTFPNNITKNSYL